MSVLINKTLQTFQPGLCPFTSWQPAVCSPFVQTASNFERMVEGSFLHDPMIQNGFSSAARRFSGAAVCETINRNAETTAVTPLYAKDFDCSPSMRVTSAQFVRKMSARHDFYESTHPYQQYMDKLASRIKQDKIPLRVLITKGWDEINAVALPNGVIIVSDRLIQSCQYEEELLFVLDHEYHHVVRQHSKKRHEMIMQATAENCTAFETRLKVLAQNRIAEYESDLGSVIDLESRGINPVGAKIFFERTMHDADKDLAHGNDLERLILFGTLTRLYDMKALALELTPLPQIIAGLETQKIKRPFAEIMSNDMTQDGHGGFIQNRDRLKSVETAAFHTLVEALPRIEARIQDRLKKRMDSLYYRLNQQGDIAVRSAIITRLQRLISQEFKGARRTQCLFVFSWILSLDTNIDIFDITDQANPLYAISDELVGCLEDKEGFDECLRLMTPENFEKLGAFVLSDARRFFTGILKTALEAGLFDHGAGFDYSAYFDFAVAWINRLAELDVARGTGSLDADQLFIDCFELGADSLPRTQSTADYIAAATETTIEPRQVFSTRFGNKIFESPARVGFSALCGLGINKNRIYHTALHRLKLKLDRTIDLPIEWHQPIAEALYDQNIERAYEKFEEHVKDMRVDEMTAALAEIVSIYGVDAHPLLKTVVEDIIESRNDQITKEIKKMTVAQRLVVAIDLLSQMDLKEPYLFLPEGWCDCSDKHTSWDDLIAVYDGLLAMPHASDDWENGFALHLNCYLGIIFKQTRDSIVAGFLRLNEHLRHPLDYYLNQIVDDHMHFREFLNHIFSFDYDKGNINHLKFLYHASFIMDDPGLAMQLRHDLAGHVMTAGSHAEQLEFLFEDPRLARGTSLEFKEDYMNRHINTPQELEELRQIVLAKVDDTPSSGAGKLVLASYLEQHVKNKFEIFKQLMNSQTDDRALRTGMLQAQITRLYGGYCDHAEDYANALIATDRAMQSLYSLDPLARASVVRDILVGKNGLLRTPRDRKKLLDYFMNNFVDANENPRLMQIVTRALNALMQQDDIESLYFAIAPLLEKRILIPPAVTPDWVDVLDDFGLQQSITTEEVLKLCDKFYAGKKTGNKKGTGAFPTYIRRVEAMIGAVPSPAKTEKMSPIALVLEMASKLGSPGVRFLQILGQFVDIPPEYQAEFNKVYDAMRGQTKLTAYMLLRREFPDLAFEITEINAPVGGGSLMTVFEAYASDGRHLVIKVLNPNAEYHLNTVYGMLEATLKSLAAEYGGSYATAEGALSEIREWIAQDINFEGFLERDAQFKKQQSTFVSPHKAVSIYVPESTGPESKYFKLEIFVEGTPLTNLKALKKAGHDPKAVVSTLVHNYIHQIQNGLVHSDVHPGNFIVTADGRIAIIDRNFFLEINDADRVLIESLVTSASQPQDLAAAVIDYFNIDDADVRDLLTTMLASTQHAQLNPLQSIQEIMVFLKASKIVVPLKITLLLKNINALDRLSRDAGFKGGLMEAFMAGLAVS
ncbi:MAG: M48 family metalloprotease [Deltaproteobacteria bacterium]|nr:M48 family metalloprotease [Deltaproteobacteria bacterium]